MEDYIVSARKYRPQTFESVVGQQTLTATLQNAIRQNHLAHAYLFCGPRGVGKTTCARIFAKTINCLSPEHGDACNECESCRAFNEQRSFNIHELDAASNNSVEDIRALIDQVRIPPQIGKYSVYIIDEVHMLSAGAFNALLKTLEEPPSYAIFILATTEKHKVLPTILSRCQVYDFQRITVADAIAHLQNVAAKEGIEVEVEALNVVAQKADGGMRDALSIFDQLVAFCGKKITYARTIEVLNVLDTEYYFRLIDLALQHDVSGALLLLNEVLNKGFDAGHFVTGLAQHLRDVLVAKDPQTLVLLESSDAIKQKFAAQASHCSPQWIFQALDLANTCDIQYRVAKNKRLTVELMLIKLAKPVEVVQAMPVAAAPQAQPRVQTATQVAPQAAAHPSAPMQQSAPQPMATPKAAPLPKMPQAMPGIPSMPSMPSIPTVNGAPAAPTASPQVQAPPTEERTRPFSVDRFNDAWAGLIASLDKEPRLVSLLQDYRPMPQDELNYRMELPNPWQFEEMKSRMPMVKKYLSDQLENDTFTITLALAKFDRKQLAYTAEEKYKLMVGTNPYLAEMKEELGLVLD